MTSKQITIDIGSGDFIYLTIADNGGSVSSTLKFNGAGPEDVEFNQAIDTVESVVLAHACAGVDVEDENYIRGICTVLESIANRF
jgi:hypothetical protein